MFCIVNVLETNDRSQYINVVLEIIRFEMIAFGYFQMIFLRLYGRMYLEVIEENLKDYPILNSLMHLMFSHFLKDFFGIVHPKILSPSTHPRIISYLYKF